MTIDTAVSVARALADPARLRLLRALDGQPRVAEDLATRLGLAASTVSFHLKKLEDAGLVAGRREQYYRVFRLVEGALDTRLAELVSADDDGSAAGDDRAAGWRARVLATFMPAGRIVQLPSQHAKRWVVLAEAARGIKADRAYTERELDALLEPASDDVCTLRRALVDEGLLDRADGSYRLRPEAPVLPRSLRASFEASQADRDTPQGTT